MSLTIAFSCGAGAEVPVRGRQALKVPVASAVAAANACVLKVRRSMQRCSGFESVDGRTYDEVTTYSEAYQRLAPLSFLDSAQPKYAYALWIAL
jgi:hypothetical protein